MYLNQKISVKHFLILILIPISLYVTFHFIVWNLYTSKIFGRTDDMYIGDIGRMSYQVDSLFPRKLEYTLPKRLINSTPYHDESIDVLTIGDSFSNAATGGTNPYYQDYLSTKYNLKVLNIMNITNQGHRLFETIVSLYNNGWLQTHKPKLIIIESAQRGVYERFAKDFDWTQKQFNITPLITSIKTNDSYIPNLKQINTANYKFLYYGIKYTFNQRAQKDVVKMTLNKPLFSTPTYKTNLLFHYSDVQNIKNDPKRVMLINKNFNHLAKILKPLNIKLLFLVAPDKYDVYYDYIENNKFQKNLFFKLINPLKKEYLFIDSEKILKDKLSHNTLDLYYSDDTHWSYKASDAITNDQVFQKLFGNK
ncbi:hypothetical protein [Sulfurimonas sp. C5]|uniref:hypothetical protein n=1 Tax=Sulfurimonas sp. C5 TaxID=3036947 RepID=UPI0024539991|nr:hypothetical protein [Sulfurimonas sp. C5]MDH4945503.1 hypothetical protein [Sulfurimonas sp. C5]